MDKINRINILYCFDSKFWRMAAVSMESLLSKASDTTKIKIYCMVAPGTDGHRKIKKIINSHKSGDGLVWRVIKPCENPFQQYEYSRWSPVIFYRCIAHRIFPDVTKMIYLDSDTLICRDLSELYNTNISDYVLGGVRDLAPTNDKYHPQGRFVKDFSEKYLNNGAYINSGVLLLNFAKLRDNEHLLFETKIPLFYPDQDLINAAFVGKIKILPLKYNLAPGILVPRIFTPTEAHEALYGGHVIIHCYSVKPYDYNRAPDAIYEMFSKHANNIGMDPKQFMKWDKEYARKKVKTTFIPHIKIKQNHILFFGMEIKV